MDLCFLVDHEQKLFEQNKHNQRETPHFPYVVLHSKDRFREIECCSGQYIAEQGFELTPLDTAHVLHGDIIEIDRSCGGDEDPKGVDVVRDRGRV